jgi:serine/threonine protein kinase
MSPDPALFRNERTQLMGQSIIQRLRESGEFSETQIELIQKEVTWYFSNASISEVHCDSLPAGTKLGSYVLDTSIGFGGSGHVYRAHHKDRPEQFAALKLMRHLRSTERFHREMKLVQRLAHPNVVVAYEVGVHAEVPFIVMEEIPGPDLNELVHLSGPISWQKSIDYILDAARGLQHAHERGLVHRDVKPGNLLLDGNRVKVTDLGLAVLSERDEIPEGLFQTRTEIACGTPEFMAPEQALSLASATLLSDIYALGATWFFLLTGRPRVGGKALLEKILNLRGNKNLESLPIECAPENVRCILSRMVEYEPSDRFQSMAEVAESIELVRETISKDNLRHDVGVLIVEDDQDDLFLTIEMLKRTNTSVIVNEAHTLAEAIQITQINCNIDLILLDLQLPDSSGIETVINVRSVAPYVPIIVLTGQQNTTVGEACIEAGADDFICKNDLNANLLERIIFITLSRYRRRALAST